MTANLPHVGIWPFKLENIHILSDRSQSIAGGSAEQIIHNVTNRPKIWKVYTRKGKKGNSG